MALLTEIDRSVLKTIIYFNIFDYPLTDWEIWRFLINKNQTFFAGVKNSLNNLKPRIEFHEGFYFLPGKKNLVTERKKKYLQAEKKFKIAIKNIKLLKKMPFVEAIFVCNSLAYSNADTAGDIDLAIITTKNKIWTARFFCALLMKILKRRPTPKTSQNKICLSFYLSKDDFNLKKYSYENDIRFYFWIRQMQPIFDPQNLFSDFQTANNWLKNHLANFTAYKTNDRRSVAQKSCWQKFTNLLASLFPEKFYKKIQLKILPAAIINRINDQNTDVIINDQILKFHTQGSRREINEQWQKKCREIIPKLEVTDLIKLVGQAL